MGGGTGTGRKAVYEVELGRYEEDLEKAAETLNKLKEGESVRLSGIGYDQTGLMVSDSKRRELAYWINMKYIEVLKTHQKYKISFGESDNPPRLGINLKVRGKWKPGQWIREQKPYTGIEAKLENFGRGFIRMYGSSFL